jgi:glycosyltransferase involved in cell wall biosynthesis
MLFRGIFHLADAVLAVSAASAVALEQAYGITGISVVPNPAPESPMAYSREFGGTPTLVYLGGFANPVKGGANLLVALGKRALANTHVVLAGPGQLPEDFNPQDGIVEWRGWLDEVERDGLLRESGIFVLPSSSEGLPMALLEAMAYAMPIVATTVGGVPDLLTDGIDALLVPPEDPEQLAEALDRLTADTALRERLGSGARKRARRLNAEDVTAELQTLYDQLLS